MISDAREIVFDVLEKLNASRTETMHNKGGITCRSNRFDTCPAPSLQISDDTIEKLRQIFLSLDDDNSGTLSARELSSSGKMNIFESLVCTTTRFAHDLVIDRNGIGLHPKTCGARCSPNGCQHQPRWRRLMRHWSV